MWGFGRLCAGGSDLIFGFYLYDYSHMPFVDLQNGLNVVVEVFLIFLYLFISEIVPIQKSSEFAILEMFDFYLDSNKATPGLAY